MRFPSPAGSAIIAVFTASAWCQYGVPVDGHPSWQERSVILLTNAVRTAPVEYRDAYVGDYQILLPANYPAVDPVWWNLPLNRVARLHAQDMADNCGLSHNSCNSTEDFSARIKRYYTETDWLAENIAMGRTTPQATIQQWIMDGETPAVDNGDEDGHRKNIMNGVYREMGAGYATGNRSWNGSLTTQTWAYWVQDFARGAPDFTSRITAGSHLFLRSGTTTFMANFFDASGKTPSSATVTVDGAASALAREMGSGSRGTWSVDLPRAAACRGYFFTFTDGDGDLWRYPESGSLMTFNEGGCTQDFTTAVWHAAAPRTMRRPAAAPLRVCRHDGRIILDLAGAGRLQPDCRVEIHKADGALVFAGAADRQRFMWPTITRGWYTVTVIPAAGSRVRLPLPVTE